MRETPHNEAEKERQGEGERGGKESEREMGEVGG